MLRRALGVDWISLTPFGFVGRGSDEVRTISHPGSETDARLGEETRAAHRRGLKVALKPHLWLDGGAWQGALAWRDDDSFRRFFASNRELLLGYARLAERERIDLVVIGTELKSATQRDPAAFRALITAIRGVYKGPLTYAANWDVAESISFWDALDYIGVDAYQPLLTKPGATVEELREAWRPITLRFAALSGREKRPIVLTELGYRASPDAACDPSAWPEHDRAPRFDPEHQARCYRAALLALDGQPWLAGVFVWKWFTDSADEQGPTDCSPAGRLILRGFTNPICMPLSKSAHFR